MGGFATSVFNLLLGWIRNFVSGFWSLVNSQQARNGLIWLGDHWLLLVVVIALGGIVLDYLIWFIRWRPYYVWRSWWRRLTHREQPPRRETPGQRKPREIMEETAVYTPRPYPSPQVTQAEEPAYAPYPGPEAYPPPTAYAPPQAAENQAPYVPEAPYQPYDGYGYDPAYGQANEGYDPGAYDGGWVEPYPQGQAAAGYGPELPEHPGLSETGLQESLGWAAPPEPSQAPRRESRAPRSQRSASPLKKVRSGISQVAQRMAFLGRDEDEEPEMTYTAPPPAVDKRHAFHAPVYPSRWSREAKSEDGEDQG